MSNPNTRLMTEQEEAMYDAGLMDGRDNERERIIELLETEMSELESHDGTCDCKIRADELRVAIDLIKGENK